jgi:hypothetical protein
MAYAWDLETNVRQTKIFVVKHERKAKGSISKLDDPRDIYELVANNGARRLRSCILGVIPGDVVDAAVEKCKNTMATGNTKPLSDRIRDMIVVFDKEYRVSQTMLEKYIGCKVDSFSEQDFVRLKNVYRSLRDGMSKREDYFDIKTTEQKEVKSDALNDFENHLKQTEDKADGAEQQQLPLE